MDRPRAYSIGTGVPPEERDDIDELKTENKELTQILTTAIITGTAIRQESKNPFTEYEILVTEDISSWIIKRRYKQFYKLNDYLKSTFGALVPKSFPPKQISTSKNQALSPHAIDRRHQILQNWLQLVLNNKVLSQDAKLRLFLTQDRVQVDFRPVVNRNRSRSDAKYQSANDYMGYLYHYKKGHWKKRWFILRQGLLYKYASPKDKHPYGWYDLKDAKATALAPSQIEQLKTVERKIKRRDSGKKSPETMAPSFDRRVNFKIKSSDTTEQLTLTPDTDGPLSDPVVSPKKGTRSGHSSPSIERRGSITRDRGDYGFALECEQLPKMIFTTETESERVCWLAAFNKPTLDSQNSSSPGTMSPRPRAASAHDVMTLSRDSTSSSIFGVPLDQIDEIDIDGVPVFISTILDYIEATALHKEDLFTYSPDANVKKLIENQGDLDLTVIDSPHAVAGLVIEWLVDLPTPIIPDDFYDAFFGAFKIEYIAARHAVVKTVISQLPEINRCLLFKLFRFLHVASNKKPMQKERVVKLFGRLVFRPLPDHDKNGSVYKLTSELIEHYTLIEPPNTPRDPKIERTDSFYLGLISKLKTLDQGVQGNMIVEQTDEGSTEEVTIVTQVASNERERFITIQHKKSPRNESPLSTVSSMPKITIKSSPTTRSPIDLDEPFDDVSSSAEEESIRQVQDKQLFDAIFGFESDEGSDMESDDEHITKERLSNSIH